MNHFLYFCAGAEAEILEEEECATERGKYAAIGMTVLLTGIVASLSGGFAMYAVFQSLIPSVSFGGLWGVMIFNLERMLILNTKKTQKDEEL